MTGLIILAAGESSRLGQPKQNLLFKGKTLLQRAAETGYQSRCNPIVVVLGANADKIAVVKGVTTIHNKNWKQGISCSIKEAVREINNDISVNNVIIMLCDQPFVSAELLNLMIDKQIETGKQIVACAYNGITGVPVLFDRSLFTELLQLQGNEGARTILKTHPNAVATTPFEHGSIDIDTIEDYERLIRS